MTGYLAVLNAEQAYQQARLSLVQAEADRFTDTAALFQALGGGWWHRNRSRERRECAVSVKLQDRRCSRPLRSSPPVRPADETSNGATPVLANVRLTKAQRAHIHLYTVVPVGYRQRIEAPGTVDFDNNQATSVVSPFTGPVTRIFVALGQHVTKGQPLAAVASADVANGGRRLSQSRRRRCQCAKGRQCRPRPRRAQRDFRARSGPSPDRCCERRGGSRRSAPEA